jgi:hypothetical protein
LAVLRTAAPDSGGALSTHTMLAANRELFERARRLGIAMYEYESIRVLFVLAA